MRIATIIFTYNRPYHTEKVLEALRKNDILPEKLIIFQDGLKQTTDISDWEKVGQVIGALKWCDTEVHIASENKGLAESVIFGVTYALKQYDAAIILEDDCVPHPKFMSYMISGLKKYENNKQVYSIGGCGWPVDLSKKEADAFFCGRISSWGWGTWKDRWKQYERDYMIINKIKSDDETRKRLEIWGQDLEATLIGNVTGQSDSWAAFWALKVIEKGGYCLSPFESLIANIGLDGTGRHSGTKQMEMKCRAVDNMNDYVLPDVIECTEECETEFKMFFSATSAGERLKFYQDILCSWVTMKQKGKTVCKVSSESKEPIAIWGKGCLCDLLIAEWEDREQISYIIESRPDIGKYHGIPIISINELPLNVKTIVVMPVFAMESILYKIQSKRRDVRVIGIDELISDVG